MHGMTEDTHRFTDHYLSSMKGRGWSEGRLVLRRVYARTRFDHRVRDRSGKAITRRKAEKENERRRQQNADVIDAKQQTKKNRRLN